MKKSKRIPLAGVAGSGLLSFLLIHFWFARFYASLTNRSEAGAYWFLVSLLLLLSVWRIWQIMTGKDIVTALVNRIMKK